jgi:hypothetical protein
MLALKVTVQGDRVVIEGLQQIAAEMPKAVGRGLSEIVMTVHRIALQWLSGPGRSQMAPITRHKTLKDLDRPNTRGQFDDLGARPGSYPVPVITGNLRRLLDWIGPNKSKAGNGASFTTGPMEAMLYDSAEYSSVIHGGTGSSAKFGPRAFIDDSFDSFNAGAGPVTVLDRHIQEEIDKRNLRG